MNQRFVVTSSIVLAMLMASMDTTILHTTMPVIAGELGQFHLYAWSLTAYVLSSTALMPIAGRLADLFGRKRLFAGGILIFMFGSILCGSASSMVTLVVYRALQGIGAGVLMPLVQIIAGDLYTVENRGKIQALFTSMWMISAILAPVLGAFFVEVASWRWIFYINAPVCLLSLLMLLPYRDVYEGSRAPVDGVGALLFAVGTGALLLVTAVQENRLLWAACGLLILAVFVLHERRHPAPMIPGRMFRRRTVVWILVNNFLVCLSMFGLSNYVPLYLQDIGYSVLYSGLTLICISAGWMTLSVFSGKWILRYGYRPLLLLGNGLLLASACLLMAYWPWPYFVMFCAALYVLGLAFGLTFTVSIIGAQQLVDERDKGISTSLQMFVRNTGLAAGVSVMGLLMNQAPSIPEGMHVLIMYGLAGSAVAFVSALRIRDTLPEKESV